MLDSIRNNSRSLGVKLIFGAIIIVFVFWGVGNFSGGGVGNVAEVNGKPVTLNAYLNLYQRIYEAEQSRNPALAANPELQMLLKQQVLGQLVRAELWRQEAERLGLFVTPYELREAIAGNRIFQDDRGRFDSQKYLEILKLQGINVGEFEDNVAADELVVKLQSYILMGVGVTEEEAKNFYDFIMSSCTAEYVLFPNREYLTQAEVSGQEIEDYYQSRQASFMDEGAISLTWLPISPDVLAGRQSVSDQEVADYHQANESHFLQPGRYRASHIFLEAPAGMSEGERAEKFAELEQRMAEIQLRLEQGEDFGDLAIEFTEDEDSRMRGGDLGWIESDKIVVPELQEALSGLQPGQTSGLVRSPAGLHIFKLTGKEEAAQRPMDDQLRAEIAAILLDQKAQSAYLSIMAEVDDDLSLGASLEELAGKFGVEPQSIVRVTEDRAASAIGLLDDGRSMLSDIVNGMALHTQEAGTARGDADAGETRSASQAALSEDEARTPSAMIIPVPLSTRDGIAVVRIDEAQPARLRSIQEATPEIEAVLVIQKARSLAHAAASEALGQFSGSAVPEHLQERAHFSEPFVRALPSIPELGDSTFLAEALFSAPGHEWLPNVYDTSEGAVIARVVSISGPDQDEWIGRRDMVMRELHQTKAMDVVNAFLQNLYDNAKITQTPGVLEQIRMR